MTAASERTWRRFVLALALVGCSSGTEAPGQGTSPAPRHDPPLESGLRITYRMDLDRLESGARQAALERAALALRARIGVTPARVVVEGATLVVEIPPLGDEAIQRLKDLLGRPCRLELRMVEDGSETMKAIYARVFGELRVDHPGRSDADILDQRLVTDPEGIGAEVDFWRHDELGTAYSDWYLTAEDRDRSSGRERLASYLASTPLDGGRAWGFEKLPPRDDAGAQPRSSSWRTYLLRGDVVLDGSSVKGAKVETSSIDGQPQVSVELDARGAARFADATAAFRGHKLAIILDDRVMSAPVIMERIPGGRFWLSPGAGEPAAVAEDLAICLPTALAAPIRIESETPIERAKDR